MNRIARNKCVTLDGTKRREVRVVKRDYFFGDGNAPELPLKRNQISALGQQDFAGRYTYWAGEAKTNGNPNVVYPAVGNFDCNPTPVQNTPLYLMLIKTSKTSEVIEKEP